MNNQIQIVDKRLLSQLPAEMQKVVAARTDVSLNNLPDEEINIAISRIIVWCVAFTGRYNQFSSNEDQKYFCEVFKQQLFRRRYSVLTMSEVTQAIQNGMQGEYQSGDEENKFIAISIDNFRRFMDAYKKRQRFDAWSEYNKLTEKNEVENKPSEEEREIMNRNFSLMRFDEFMLSGEFEDFGHLTCDYLKKKGLLNFTQERKDELWHKARQLVMRDARREKNTELIREIHIGGTSFYDRRVSRYKDEYLLAYFKDIKEAGMTLKMMLDSEEEK